MSNKTVLMNDLAERIAHRNGYTIKDSKEFLHTLEDVMVEALEDQESIKFGMFFKLYMKHYEEQENKYDGVNKRYYHQPATWLPRMHPLSRMTSLRREESSNNGD